MKLFEPGKIGKMALENRIIMAPMGMQSEDGKFSRRNIDYYAARAQGGVGLVITGGSLVDTTIEDVRLTMVDSDDKIASLTELASAVHQYEKKVAVQLVAGLGRLGFPGGPKQPVAPSELPCFGNPRAMTREMTIEEIEKLVKAFGNATRIVRAAGMDAVEVHGYGGYLLDQFQTALWNKRTDKYGGDLDGRLRFSMEIISEIKRIGGKDFPVIFKFTPKHYIGGGRELDEGLEIARRLEDAGVAALHIDVGSNETWYLKCPPIYMQPGPWIEIAEAVKKVVNIPVIIGGKLGYPDLAESILKEGKADFIALGRPLLADPEWPKKVKEGRLDDIKPCIGCHAGCWGRTMRGKYVSCAVNPATGVEKEYALVPATRRKSVLIIGGGPAGLEAARVAATRGHEVTLWERSGRLGGNLIPASVPEFKHDIRSLIDYLSNQVKKLGVKVELMKEATPELVRQANPDTVIVAAGATPVIPEIPGVDRDNVLSAVDLLSGKTEAGETVLIAGGGSIGCEIAVYLAQKGKKVTLIEMKERLLPPEGTDLHPINKMMLLKMVADSGAEVLTSTRLLEITGKGAIVDTNGSTKSLKVDSVVLALGLKSESTLKNALEGKVGEVFAVGDCTQPKGTCLHAIWEGFQVAREV
ncbi:FAD-dependent oxidoreductase [Chloroflexota bacterium]